MSHPTKKIFGHAPSIGHLRIFRSKCFIKVTDEAWTKLGNKAKECPLIRYKGDSIYVIVDNNWKKLSSHNVIFMENQMTRRDNRLSIEFSSQNTETSNDSNTHMDAKDKTPR